MSKSMLDVRPDGEAVLVEAATAEEALTEVTSIYGTGANILGGKKVLRGGVGGFFAREMVQLRVRPPAPQGDAERRSVRPPEQPSWAVRPPQEPRRSVRPPDGPAVKEWRPPTIEPADGNDASAPPAGDGAQIAGSGVERLLAAAAADINGRERTFQDSLREQLATTPLAEEQPPADAQPEADARPEAEERPQVDEQPVVAEHAAGEEQGPAAESTPLDEPAEEPTAAPEPAPAPIAASPDLSLLPPPPASPTDGSGLPAWSTENMRRLGLPDAVLGAVEGLDGSDDLTWVHAIGKAVATLCRPLPTGDGVMAGPRAARLGRSLGLPTADARDDVAERGPLCVSMRASRKARGWLAWARAGRWLHVVAGGEGWSDLLFDEPLAVSWVGDENLPAAVKAAADVGLVLGYGLRTDRREPALRATPVDVAMAIRRLLPLR